MMTTSSNGWAWILRDRGDPIPENTNFGAGFDGAFTGTCPHCGRDCAWDAFYGLNGVPLCDHCNDRP